MVYHIPLLQACRPRRYGAADLSSVVIVCICAMGERRAACRTSSEKALPIPLKSALIGKRDNGQGRAGMISTHRRRTAYPSFQGFFTPIDEEITIKDRVYLLRHVGTLLESHPGEMLRRPVYSRPFHIVAKMNKALDEVRAGESRRMASEGRAPLLKTSRWLLHRSLPAAAPGTDSQLFPGANADFQRRHRGLEP